jgi:hypothetical protein
MKKYNIDNQQDHHDHSHIKRLLSAFSNQSLRSHSFGTMRA